MNNKRKWIEERNRTKFSKWREISMCILNVVLYYWFPFVFYFCVIHNVAVVVSGESAIKHMNFRPLSLFRGHQLLFGFVFYYINILFALSLFPAVLSAHMHTYTIMWRKWVGKIFYFLLFVVNKNQRLYKVYISKNLNSWNWK